MAFCSVSRSRIQVNPDYLLDHPLEIVPYFTNQEFDETMALVSQELRNRKMDMTKLTPKQRQELDKAFATGAVSDWLSEKFGAQTSKPDKVCMCSSWILAVTAQLPMQLLVTLQISRVVPCNKRCGH